ncbi:Bug family tripartite tricarboxylate transporter substrate binding protein [uncultured Enterovirga sp.]|uniref:Bug family tripartite tricarboxylate transporter substrate binding protein n=1 Tax=uncultured Enterovirga sp. TaxID=2026352 RepID=UPI0035CA280D
MGLKASFRGVVAALILGSAWSAHAQTYPDRPIRVIIPYAPAGGTDIVVRMIAPAAGAALGQSIVVDNRPGASTMTGTGAVARSPADGYTLLATDSALLINPGLFKSRLPYDTAKELKGVTMMATSPAILVVNPKIPAKTLAELTALAKAKPGVLNYGSGGIGTAPHLAGELMKLAAGIDVQHVAYRGTSPALTGVLSGQVELAFIGISSAAPFLATGELRAIAITGGTRHPSLPDVPTFKESGLDVDGSSYWGIYAPAEVPDEIVAKLHRAFTEALRLPENEKKLASLGYAPIANTPQEHTAQFRLMIDQWTSVVERAGIKVE